MNWLQMIQAGFAYGFLWRALIVGIAIALSSSFLGTFLVLKRYSMIGESLAHVSFAAIAIALFTQTSTLLVSILLVSVVSIFILKLSERTAVHGDAAIGLIASTAMAIGTLLSSIGKGFNVDLFSYLFGNILLIDAWDVYLSIGVSVIVVTLVLVFYPDLFAITYDQDYAKVSGIKTGRLNYLLAVLTAITIVVGIRAIGTLLISSLIIFPTVTALQFSKGFRYTIFAAALLSVITVVLGLLVSFVLNLPSGSTIVVVNGLIFVGVYITRLALGYRHS
jgi:zinc transport system permease protein